MVSEIEERQILQVETLFHYLHKHRPQLYPETWVVLLGQLHHLYLHLFLGLFRRVLEERLDFLQETLPLWISSFFLLSYFGTTLSRKRRKEIILLTDSRYDVPLTVGSVLSIPHTHTPPPPNHRLIFRGRWRGSFPRQRR